MTAACMGGWCTRREKCPHFHAVHRAEPAERLCIPGQDGDLLLSLETGRARQVPRVFRIPSLQGPLSTGEPDSSFQHTET